MQSLMPDDFRLIMIQLNVQQKMKNPIKSKKISYQKLSHNEQHNQQQGEQQSNNNNINTQSSFPVSVDELNNSNQNKSRRDIKKCLQITLFVILMLIFVFGLNYMLSSRLKEIKKQYDNKVQDLSSKVQRQKQLRQQNEKQRQAVIENSKNKEVSIRSNDKNRNIYEQSQLLKNLNQPLISRKQITSDITLVNEQKDLSIVELTKSASNVQKSLQNQQHNQHLQFKKQSKAAIKTPQNPTLQPLSIQFDPKTAPRSGISQQKLQQWKKFIALKNQPSISNLSRIEHDYFSDLYQTQKDQQLPFCIVIPTYNNIAEQRHISNLNSIFQQNYKNYRILLIDDASTDGTGQDIQKYIKDHRISRQKLSIIINKQRKGAMANIYYAAHQFCLPQQIMIIIDGDDQIIGKEVFKLFNNVFHNNDAWIVYTNSITTNGELGYSRPYRQEVIDKKLFRKVPFTISHLRAFYTKLFRLIDKQDLKDTDGQWFKAANDVAIFLPMLQLSQHRIIYIPQISYLYNVDTGNNNHRIKLKQQKQNQKYIRNQKKIYETLEYLFDDLEKARMDAMIGREIQIKIKKQQGVNGVNENSGDEEVQVYGWEM